MIKTLLAYIFVISTLLFYIYYGFRLTENFKTKTEIVIYAFSYILLGITIINLILVSKYWEVLSVKQGPPGPRGLMGEEGDSGHNGSCSIDHNIMFALIQIKRGIAEELTSIDTELKMEDIYNEENNTLTNNTLDTLINRIVQSKEFDTILLRPDTSDTIKYGKSLKDIVGYLKSVIIGWARDIYELPGGADFFKSIDGSFADSNEIEDYFHNEIEKYDIWYWGGTRVFKPLEIMVMRQTQFRGSNGEMHQNSAFPQDDLKGLDIIEIEYSDTDTSKLRWLWDARRVGKNRLSKDKITDYDVTKNMTGWENNTPGLYGSYIEPAIYIPKILIRNKKRYYPVGCVIIETDPENKSSTKKKTILVSGDVIIPDKFNLMWNNRVRINLIKNGGKPSDGTIAALFWRLETSNTDYVVLGDIVNGMEWDRGSKQDESRSIIKTFLDNPLQSLEVFKTTLNFYNKANYTGIVAIPKKYVKQVNANATPNWSYKLNGDQTGNFSHCNKQVDIFTSENQGYNIMRLKNASNELKVYNRGGNFYKIDTEKLKQRNNPLKSVEPENNDLGFGYYGYPYLITDKYSIFKFLDLVPEGLIINYNNNRKLYIRHYGGAEMNRYNIFKYDTETGRYNKALRVNGPSNVEFARMKPADPRFAFSYEVDTNDKRFIRFKSISNPDDGYLTYISQITNTDYDSERNSRPGGVSIDHTRSIFVLESEKGEISNKNKKLFMFLQAHGRGLTDVSQPRLDLANMEYPGSKKSYTPTITTIHL
jgi:hypothetical protein